MSSQFRTVPFSTIARARINSADKLVVVDGSRPICDASIADAERIALALNDHEAGIRAQCVCKVLSHELLPYHNVRDGFVDISQLPFIIVLTTKGLPYGNDFCPRFQFTQVIANRYTVRPVVSEVNRRLGLNRGLQRIGNSWDIVIWWFTPHDDLDGLEPHELVGTDREEELLNLVIPRLALVSRNFSTRRLIL